MPSLKHRKVLLGLPGTLVLCSHFAVAAPPAPAPVPVPANDKFVHASLLNSAADSTNSSNAGASREAGEPLPAGGTSGHSVWYKWTAPSTGNWDFVAISSNFNPVLGIYTGSVVSSLSEVASSDAQSGRIEQVSFAATAGTTYYIDVAGSGTQAGQFFLNWSAQSYVLSGRITDAAGKPAHDVTVELSGPTPAFVFTDSKGYYTSPDLQSGNYTVTPTANYMDFEPASRNVEITAETPGINFTSSVHPGITVSNVTVAEGNVGPTAASFVVKLSKASTKTITVDYATQDDTALSSSDYTSASGTVIFAPGETTKTVTVTVNGDTTNEPTETFNINLSAPTNSTITDGLGVGTITNDDPAPIVSVSNAVIAEGDSGTKTVDFTVSLSAPSAKTVTVSAKTTATVASPGIDPATAGTDYVAVPATQLTFAPGETSRTISVTINGDTLNEQDETFNLNLSSPGNATIVSANGVGNITNDDATPSFSIGDVEVTEGNTGTVTAAFTVTLSAPSARTVKVTAATSDGATAAGADYTAIAPTVLTFTPGQTSKVVNVLVKGDLSAEPTETYNVLLTDPVNATITKSSGLGTILDNDAQPSISVVAPSVAEGNSGIVALPFVLKLSNPSSVPVTVEVHTTDAAASSATAGSDYTALETTTVTFAPGETSKTVNVSVNGDLTNENNEKLALVLANPTNATLVTTSVEGTITNDDALPALSVTGGTIVEGDSGTKTFDFTVSLSQASSKPVTVSFKTANGSTNPATAGSDYVAVPATTLTFAPGETTKTVSVTINGDTLYETDEKVNGLLSTPTNAAVAQATGVVTITNDDAQPTVFIDPASYNVNVLEGNTGTKTVAVIVKLSAPTSQTVTVPFATQDGSGTAGLDYVAQSGTLTFTPGQTSKTINVVIKGDTLIEGNENFALNLTGPVSGAAIGADAHAAFSTIQILDDDATPSISIDNPTIVEGNSGTSTLKFTVSLSNPSSKTVTAKFKTGDGTTPGFQPATAGEDYVAVPSTTVTFAPGETSKTVLVTINGDEVLEGDEQFVGVVSTPANATISAGIGFATITNDDVALPTLSIDSPSIEEGNDGTSTLTFTISLSSPSNKTVTASFQTYDFPGGAIAGEDYVAVPSTLVTFEPGETTQTVSVTINGDELVEGDEFFGGSLNDPINATIATGTGTATITNDDVAPLERGGSSDNES